MNYLQTVDWLYSQLPSYQKNGIFKYKLNLSSINNVCNYLNNPQNSFKSIHITGTNGKGSSSHMLASVFQEANFKVGLYTSPHLIDFRERIKINGIKISKKEVVSFVLKNKVFFQENKISFFEMTVALAFDFFSKSKIDIAIVETGLGGRLDATNIINPILSLITNVGLDHQKYLGNTLKKIAEQKAGIIKKTGPVVVSEDQSEVRDVFIAKANKIGTNIFFAKANTYKKYNSDLNGSFQKKNLNGVIKSLSVLKEYNLTKKNIETGLLNVKKNTGIRGRWEILSENPKIICDVGHNINAFKQIVYHLKNLTYKKLRIVIGFVEDKDFKNILNILPKNASYYFCKPKIKRGLDAFGLLKYGNKIGLKGKSFESVKIAYETCKFEAENEDLIFIGGSNFIVAELL